MCNSQTRIAYRTTFERSCQLSDLMFVSDLMLVSLMQFLIYNSRKIMQIIRLGRVQSFVLILGRVGHANQGSDRDGSRKLDPRSTPLRSYSWCTGRRSTAQDCYRNAGTE